MNRFQLLLPESARLHSPSEPDSVVGRQRLNAVCRLRPARAGPGIGVGTPGSPGGGQNNRELYTCLHSSGQILSAYATDLPEPDVDCRRFLAFPPGLARTPPCGRRRSVRRTGAPLPIKLQVDLRRFPRPDFGTILAGPPVDGGLPDGGSATGGEASLSSSGVPGFRYP